MCVYVYCVCLCVSNKPVWVLFLFWLSSNDVIMWTWPKGVVQNVKYIRLGEKYSTLIHSKHANTIYARKAITIKWIVNNIKWNDSLYIESINNFNFYSIWILTFKKFFYLSFILKQKYSKVSCACATVCVFVCVCYLS